MTAGRNYNIQTVRKVLATGKMSATRTAIASTVPAGMKRYVTFVRLERNNASVNEGSRVFLISAAVKGGYGSSTAVIDASGGLKMMLELMSSVAQPKQVQLPLRIDTENPLFSIAAGKYLTVAKSALAIASEPCTLFVQYYDQ